MAEDSGCALPSLRVDGGAANNNLLMQIQADLLGHDVVRPRQLETTALGAACLAGLAVGIFEGLDDVRSRWQVEKTFGASADLTYTAKLKKQWSRAVDAVRAYGTF